MAKFRNNSQSDPIKEIKSKLNQLSKDINQRFVKQEQFFNLWKSEIHDLIDKGFTTRAKKLDEDVDILNNRTVNLRQRTENLEKTVFGKSL